MLLDSGVPNRVQGTRLLDLPSEIKALGSSAQAFPIPPFLHLLSFQTSRPRQSLAAHPSKGLRCHQSDAFSVGIDPLSFKSGQSCSFHTSGTRRSPSFQPLSELLEASIASGMQGRLGWCVFFFCFGFSFPGRDEECFSRAKDLLCLVPPGLCPSPLFHPQTPAFRNLRIHPSQTSSGGPVPLHQISSFQLQRTAVPVLFHVIPRRSFSKRMRRMHDFQENRKVEEQRKKTRRRFYLMRFVFASEMLTMTVVILGLGFLGYSWIESVPS